MVIWEIASLPAREKEELESFLSQGYEPFSVIQDIGGEVIWLKKWHETGGTEYALPNKRGQHNRGKSSSSDKTDQR